MTKDTDAPAEGDVRRVPTFDWYAVTLDYDQDVLAQWLSEEFGGTVERGHPKQGYKAALDVKREGTTVAAIWYGGNNGTVHVESSGEHARILAAFMQREMQGYYRVTRVDSAYDFIEGEPWAALLEACMTVADYLPSGELRARQLGLRTVGDWLRDAEGNPDGRTLYVGSKNSPVGVRLYEKGKQLRKAFPDQADKFPVGWCRLELQWRPEKEARRTAADLSPVEVWGAGAWSRDLHAHAVGMPVDKLGAQHKSPPDDARAFHYLVKQYGGLMGRIVAEYDVTPYRAGYGWEVLQDKLRAALG